MPIGSPPLAFTDYRPTPDGQGTMFRQPDGREFMSFGPDADALRRQIDENRPPDQRQAFNESAPLGSAESVPDVPPPMGPPEPVRQGVTVESTSATPEPARSGTTVVEEPKHSPVLPGSAPLPPAGELPDPVGAGAAPPGAGTRPVPTMPESSGRVYSPGTNPARDAARAVAVPASRTLTSEGGIVNPEDQAARAASYGQRNAAMEQIAGVEEQAAQYRMAQNQQAIAQADLEAARLKDEAIQLQAKHALIQTKFDNAMGAAQKDFELQTSRKVDQDRIWQGKDGARIVSMIGVALGALGAAINGGKNEALEIVNRRIDNDIQSQRDEIARGTQRAGNGISALKERYGVSTDEAAAMLKMNYSRQVDAMAQKRAALDGTPAAMLQLAKIRPELAKWQADAQDKLHADIAGKVTSTETAKMVTPRSGGYRPQTLEEQIKEQELRARGKLAENKYAHGGLAVKEEDPNKPGGEVTQGLARADVATVNALSVLHELRTASKKMGSAGNFMNSVKGMAADTEYDALVNHGANAIASMEAQGMAPDQKRVDELIHVLRSSNPWQAEAHIDSLIDIAQKKYKAIRNTSAAVGKVGTIGPYDGGGGRGEE